MTIDEMNQKKKEYGYSYKYIAETSGVPISTVQKVLGKITSAPRKTTLDALYKVFRTDERHVDDMLFSNIYDTGYACEGNEDDYDIAGSSALKSESVIYGYIDGNKNSIYKDKQSKKVVNRKADKTIKDYLALPEGVRAELIDCFSLCKQSSCCDVR